MWRRAESIMRVRMSAWVAICMLMATYSLAIADMGPPSLSDTSEPCFLPADLAKAFHFSEEMLDIAHTATRKIYPVRNTLGVITVSGGAGVLISDVAEHLGLAMPEMPQDAQARLRDLVPFCGPRNPVDATAQVSNDVTLVKKFMDSMVRDGGYASVLGFFSMTASARRWPAIRASAMRDGWRSLSVMIFMC